MIILTCQAYLEVSPGTDLVATVGANMNHVLTIIKAEGNETTAQPTPAGYTQHKHIKDYGIQLNTADQVCCSCVWFVCLSSHIYGTAQAKFHSEQRQRKG